MGEWGNSPTAAWGFLIIGVGGSAVAAYLAPSIGIPLGVFLMVIGICLLLRAYGYKDKPKKRTAEPVLEIIEVRRANYKQVGHTLGLVIENKGTDRTEDCRGELIEIEFANPKKGQSMYRWEVNQPLAWAEQQGDGKENGPFTMLGKDTKVLWVIIFRYVDGRPEVEIAYSASQQLRVNHRITGIEDAYMVISVTSLHCLPIYAVCRYRNTDDKIRWNPKLELCAVIKDKPTISSYRTSDSHKEGSQTE